MPDMHALRNWKMLTCKIPIVTYHGYGSADNKVDLNEPDEY